MESYLKSLGVELSTHFVPLSHSRNAQEKHPSVNWSCAISRPDVSRYWCDYSQGIAHLECRPKNLWQERNQFAIETIEKACEVGRAQQVGRPVYAKAVPPTLADVFNSLLLDAGAVGNETLEEWAHEVGYDPDSRAAEAVYRACCEVSRWLRDTFSLNELERLQALRED